MLGANWSLGILVIHWSLRHWSLVICSEREPTGNVEEPPFANRLSLQRFNSLTIHSIPLGSYTFDSRKDDNEKDSALGSALIWAIRRRRSVAQIEALLHAGASPSRPLDGRVNAYRFALQNDHEKRSEERPGQCQEMAQTMSRIDGLFETAYLPRERCSRS